MNTIEGPFDMRNLLWMSIVVAGLLGWVHAGICAEAELVDAVECRPRAGLPNVAARLRAGETVRVAYIGGSITEAPNGWRTRTTRWFQRQYPKSRIEEVNAAIGGTGSRLGVYRFSQDVLKHRPHLVFIEFAVNDANDVAADVERVMEGMVRQAWSSGVTGGDARIDICFVYTFSEPMLATLQGGKLPRSASAMERVADYYQIPSIHMGLEAVRRIKEGKLLMKGNPSSAAGEPAAFSLDGVHPLPETGHKLYSEAMARALPQLLNSGTAGGHALDEPLRKGNLQAAKMVSLQPRMLSAGWKRLSPGDEMARVFGRELWAARSAGETISFKFTGTAVSLLDVMGPAAGQVLVSLDGQPARRVSRFDSFCTYNRINVLDIGTDLPQAVHTVTVTISSEEPDKVALLARFNQKMDDPARFKGPVWYVSQIMLVGDEE